MSTLGWNSFTTTHQCCHWGWPHFANLTGQGLQNGITWSNHVTISLFDEPKASKSILLKVKIVKEARKNLISKTINNYIYQLIICSLQVPNSGTHSETCANHILMFSRAPQTVLLHSSPSCCHFPASQAQRTKVNTVHSFSLSWSPSTLCHPYPDGPLGPLGLTFLFL